MDPTQTGAIFHRLRLKLNLLLCCFFTLRGKSRNSREPRKGHSAETTPPLLGLSPSTRNHHHSYNCETFTRPRPPPAPSSILHSWECRNVEIHDHLPLIYSNNPYLIPTFLGMSEGRPYGFIATLESLPSESATTLQFAKD
jgi:hypothetical protein